MDDQCLVLTSPNFGHQVMDDRLERLKTRLAKLEKGTLPEYQRGLTALEAEFRDRQQAARDWYQLRCYLINREHAAEKSSAQRELENRRQDLTDLLLSELAEKRRLVESERHSFDLNFDGDVHDLKQPATWKLRNRQQQHSQQQLLAKAGQASTPLMMNLAAEDADLAGSDALLSLTSATTSIIGMPANVAASPISVAGGSGGVCSASGASSLLATAGVGSVAGGVGSLTSPWCGVDPLLTDAEIQDDLRVVAKARQRTASAAAGSSGSASAAATAPGCSPLQVGITSPSVSSQQQQHLHQQQLQQPSQQSQRSPAAKLQVIDGVLFYRDRSFGRGAQVSLETRRATRCCGTIVSISQLEVIVKRASDGGKMKVSLKHLRSGKFLLKKKTS